MNSLRDNTLIRNRIFEIIEIANENDKASRAYDSLMIVMILGGLLPLMVKEQSGTMLIIDHIATVVFVIDYLLRLVTADLKLQKGIKSFVEYPFTPMAIIDLLSILPSFIVVNRGLRLFKVFRLLRSLRVFRTFRYSKNVKVIAKVFREQRDSLVAVCLFAFGYIALTAIIIFNVEPETFNTFFDAVYWATVSLTTVGYGDIYASSVIGRIIAMISSIFGIAIVALPAGIITAGYLKEIENSKEASAKQGDDKRRHNN